MNRGSARGAYDGHLMPGTERKSSFLKKRSKKLLRGCRRLVRDSRAKVLLLFFKKKPCFPID
jgi:hypothetical protein